MLVSHSLHYFLGRVVPAVASLASLAIFTRMLTADEYGIYALIFAAAGILNAVTFHWVSLSSARFFPACETEAQRDELLATVVGMLLRLFLGTAVVASVVALTRHTASERVEVGLAVLVACSLAWFDVSLRLANSALSPVRYGILTGARALLALGLGVGLVYLGFGAYGLLIALSVALLITPFLVGGIWPGQFGTRYSSGLAKRLILYGAPLTATFALTSIIDFTGRFFLAWRYGTAEVGAFAAAHDLVQFALGSLGNVIHLAAFPLVLAKFQSGGAVHANQQLRRSGLVLMVIALPAAAGMATISGTLSSVIFGAEFRSTAAEVTPWIALALFLACIKSYYLDYGFFLAERLGLQAVTVGGAALTSVVLNLMLVPDFGPVGAAMALSGAVSVGVLLGWILGRRVYPLPPLTLDAAKVAMSTAVMVAALWPTRLGSGPAWLSVQIALGIAAYVGASLILDIGGARQRCLQMFVRRS